MNRIELTEVAENVYVSTSKCLVPMESDEVVNMRFMDKSNANIKGSFDIITKSETDDKRIIAGYASVIELDQENHIIPKETLEAGIKPLLEDSDYSNLMLLHQNIQVGKILKGYKELKTHVDDMGLFIVAEIRKGLKTADEVWKAILEGALQGFSIAAEIVGAHNECDESNCWKVIDSINMFEISVCDNPVNSKSGFVVVSKGESPCDNVFTDVIAKGNQMSEEEKVKEEDKSECESSNEVTKSEDKQESKSEDNTKVSKNDDEALKSVVMELSRQVSALTGIIQEMKAKPEEEEVMDEEDEEEDEEKAKPEKEEKALPKEEEKPPVEEPPKEEEKPEEKSGESSYPAKKDFDDLKKSIDKIIENVSTSKEILKLENVLKAKDSEISILNDRVKVLEKAEIVPKTVVEEKKDVVKKGVKSSKFVKDKLGTGVFFKDPDY